MTKYTIGFEGTVTESEVYDLLRGYCTVDQLFTDFGVFIAKVTTDNPERLEQRLENSAAVTQYMQGGA